jgi:hypothetical protein
MAIRALWFSRHQPTTAQLAEIGEQPVLLGEAASVNINDDEALAGVIASLEGAIRNIESRRVRLYGVFPAPVLEWIARKADTFSYTCGREDAYPDGKIVEVYTAWNVQRSKEGEKPTFEHARFCFAGRIAVA